MQEAVDPNLVEIIDLLLKAGLGIIGLYLANSLSRQVKLRIAERRLDAYASLWDKMVVATPVRLALWNAAPLTREERKQLFRDFTTWYYHKGNGMLLEGNTRAIYLLVKDNLICPLAHYKPEALREKLGNLTTEEAQECARGYLSIRQISLLRTRMKADLGVYGPPYHRRLDENDREFLRCSDENLRLKPWGSLFASDKPKEDKDDVNPFVACRSDEADARGWGDN